jgi:predicted transcriptional regulator
MDANPVEHQETKTKTNVQTTKGKTKMAEINAQAADAAQLYSAGKPVVEVAKALGVTYGTARRLINESGTPIRDASSRLKGRTRPVK